ncbi:hypothetical protein F0225_18730 [Vibrio pectenicida]|uniref:Uncharacterized protein n=1 Tax=Vibrio pectenicida TaxID=62763 RepID=A0A7Y4EGC8_9VIBR|nr:hypothetical protein [Vibrio pectenicida]NOH73353.1 hypothetical protein [Vibrio pectenicida]
MASVKRDMLKWLYGSLTGFCAIFFLSLLSFFSSDAEVSTFLVISITCFAVCLPIFAACTSAHISMIEDDISDKIAFTAIKDDSGERITFTGLVMFAIGFSSLIFSFNTMSGFVFVWVSLYMVKELSRIRHNYLKVKASEEENQPSVNFKSVLPFYTNVSVKYKGHKY